MAVGIYPEAEAFYTSALQGPRPFSTVAGMTDRQRAGMEGALGAHAAYVPQAADIAGQYQQRAGMLGQTGGVDPRTASMVSGIGASFNPFQNPALESAISAMRSSGRRDFEQSQAPYLQDKAIAAGQAGSSRAGIAEGLVRSNLESQLGEQEALMRQRGFDTGMQQYVADRANTLRATEGFQGQGAGALDAYARASTMPRDAVLDLARTQGAYGSAEQALNQARLSEFGQQYDQMMNQPLERLQQYNTLLGQAPGSNLSSQTTQQMNPGTNWGQMAQGAITAAFGGGSQANTYTPYNQGSYAPNYINTDSGAWMTTVGR